MLGAIGAAKHFILLEQYLFESGIITDQFIEALVAAAGRGIGVYLSLDDYGSRGLKQEDRRKLSVAGVNLKFYNPINLRHFYRSLERNHRKILVVDHTVAFVGGAGINDQFYTALKDQPYSSWHDVVLMIRGPVVNDWIDLFSTSWLASTKRAISVHPQNDEQYVGVQLGRLVTAAGLGKQEITRALVNRIRNAQSCVWLTTPYFVATWKIRRSLRYAARKGVDVRLILPGPISDHPWVSHAAHRFYSRLLRSGVQIFEYQPRFTHSKIQLCDDWVSIGSSNLDRWNQYWNLDANQLVLGSEMAGYVKQLFQRDFEQCTKIELKSWTKRSLRKRMLEWFSHRIVGVLEQLARWRK
jgi:phosphatidylserine/phosphatidylglycerophosphate/cardiolipin synthase-like enzyme